jgi:hypothetical protein
MKWRLWLCWFDGKWRLDRLESGRVRTWAHYSRADGKGQFCVQNMQNFIGYEVEEVATKPLPQKERASESLSPSLVVPKIDQRRSQ